MPGHGSKVWNSSHVTIEDRQGNPRSNKALFQIGHEHTAAELTYKDYMAGLAKLS